MELELTIGGLCLLVDDLAMSAVHVIMPATHGHMGEHTVHEAKLVHPLASKRTADPIDACLIDFKSVVKSAGLKPALPSGVLDIARVSPGIPDLDREILNKPHQFKSSHVILRGGSISILRYECCKPQGPTDPSLLAAGQVRWRVELNDGDVKIPLKGPDGTDIGSVAPVVEEGVVRMGLVHAPAAEMPQSLEHLMAASAGKFDHFAAFYQLFPGATTNLPIACMSRGPSQCMSVRSRVS
jgi:hypothetical protein